MYMVISSILKWTGSLQYCCCFSFIPLYHLFAENIGGCSQYVNKDILYSTGNSTQYSVITHVRKESEKELIYI